jgi:anaerobic magnesium-protoporphyrin IX monomethyl ester cyclase
VRSHRLRIILADVKSLRGFVSKDTVVGGYGSRLEPFSRVTGIIARLKQRYHDLPSIQMAYLAAILSRAGHEVLWSRGEMLYGDVALVLSSLVDYRNEIQFAEQLRHRGVRVGFVGLAASKLPHLFQEHADFVVVGEPEEAVMRLARGEVLSGLADSDPVNDLDSLPFPRWDLVTADHVVPRGFQWSSRPPGGGFPLLASRGCPEFCTYCPHRILAGHRARSVANVVSELQHLCQQFKNPYVIFRDPLFTEDRNRCLELCDEILARGLTLTFEAETRLDRLSTPLLDRLRDAGCRALSFGVESLSAATLKKSGRRPIPEAHQRHIIEQCRARGIVTAAFYVFGFLQDDWDSISATIAYSHDLGSTFAQFKLLTPYPGTPMFKQISPRLTETDWEKYDGYTPTFDHPNLTDLELRFLLGAAYTRFYVRPSYLVNFLMIRNQLIQWFTRSLDRTVEERHSRCELADMSRSVASPFGRTSA